MSSQAPTKLRWDDVSPDNDLTMGDVLAGEASKMGLRVTSSRRTPQHNAAVGGAEKSYHLQGRAIDVGGDPRIRKAFHESMKALYGDRLKESLDEGDHIHLAWDDDTPEKRVKLKWNDVADEAKPDLRSQSQALIDDLRENSPAQQVTTTPRGGMTRSAAGKMTVPPPGPSLTSQLKAQSAASLLTPTVTPEQSQARRDTQQFSSLSAPKRPTRSVSGRMPRMPSIGELRRAEDPLRPEIPEPGLIAEAVRGGLNVVSPGAGELVGLAPKDVTNVAGALAGGLADVATGAAAIAPYGANVLKPVVESLTQPVREKTTALSERLGEEMAAHGRQGLLGDVERGIAGSLPMIGAGILAGPASPAVVGALGAAQSAGGLYREARSAGLTDKQANQVSLLGIPIGLTEMWGIGNLPSKLAKGTVVRNFIASVLKEAGEEATQEAVQTTLGNLVAKGFYDKDRGVFQNVPYSAVVAAITGGTMGAGFTAAGRMGEGRRIRHEIFGEGTIDTDQSGVSAAHRRVTFDDGKTREIRVIGKNQRAQFINEKRAAQQVTDAQQGATPIAVEPPVDPRVAAARADEAKRMAEEVAKGYNAELDAFMHDTPEGMAIGTAGATEDVAPAPPPPLHPTIERIIQQGAPTSPEPRVGPRRVKDIGPPAGTAERRVSDEDIEKRVAASVPAAEPATLPEGASGAPTGPAAESPQPPVVNRRQALYDQLAAARREPGEAAGLQQGGLSTDELAQVDTKLRALKAQATEEGRPIANVADEYLRQNNLFTGKHEMNEAQQALIRQRVGPVPRRAPVAEKQEGLFAEGIQPTLESRLAAQEAEPGVTGSLFSFAEREKPAEKEFKGGLFQADTPQGRQIIQEIVSDMAAGGVTDFREAAKQFKNDFGPADEYAQMFEQAWDVQKGVKKRGKLTYEKAAKEKPVTKATSILTAIRRAGGLDPNDSNIANYFRNKESGTTGLVKEGGLSVEDMVESLRGQGFILPGFGPLAADEGQAYNRGAADPWDSLHEAMDWELKGNEPRGTYEDANANEDWERAAKQEFAESSDHSIMARAFDNQDSPEYKDFVDGYDRLHKPDPSDEDVQFFKESARDIDLSDDIINRLIASAGEHRAAEAERAEGAAGAGSRLSKDQASFRQALIDVWGANPALAEATSRIVEAFDQTYSSLSGESAGTIFQRVRVGERKLGTRGLPEAARAVTSFINDSTAIIRPLINPNESSIAHEAFHAVVPNFMDLAERLRASGKVLPAEAKAFVRHMNNLAGWAGVKDAAEYNSLHSGYVADTLKGDGLRRYVDAQEKGARGFERYLRTGKAPTTALQAIFDQFKDWLRSIYTSLRGSEIDIPITREAWAAMDAMLGGTGEISRGGTQAKQEVINQERAQRGEDDIEKDGVRTWGEVWGEAVADVASDEGARIRTLAAQVAQKPRVLSDHDQARLVADRINLKKLYDAAEKRGLKAIQDADQYEREFAMADLENAQQLLLDNDMALYRTGSEWGRAGAIRQLLAREDYSFERAVTRAKIRKGGELPPEVVEQIRKLTDDYAAAQKEIAAKNAEIESLRATQKEAHRTGQQTERVRNWDNKARRPKEAVVADMEAVKAEFAKLAAAAKGLYQAAKVTDEPLTPELRRLVKQFARLSVEAGARTPEDVNAQVHAMVSEHFPLTPRDTADIWSEYGKKSVLSKEETDVALREAKRLQRDLNALEDISAGEVPQRSGLQRDKPTQRHRQLMREVNAKLRELGLWKKSDVDPDEQWKTTQQALQTRLRNQIADLDKEIETGTKPAPPTKLKKAYDDETIALMAERDILKRQAEDPATENKEALKRRLTEVERKLAENDLATDRKQPFPPEIYDDVEASALRKQLKDAQQRLNALRREPKRRDDLHARIADLKRRIRERDFTRAQREPQPVSPATQQLIDERDELNRVLRELAGPREISIEQRITATERALEKSLERMRTNADRGKKLVSPWSKRIGELTKELNALREANKPAASLKAYKTRTERKIADLEQQLATGDYTRKERQSLALDEEALRLGAKAKRLTSQINALIAKQERTEGVEVFTSARQTLMLANVLGTAKDVLSTTGHNISATLGMVPEAILDGLQSLRTKERVDVMLGPGGLVGAIVKGLRQVPSEAREVAKHGLSVKQAAEQEIPHEVNTGSKIFNGVLNAVSRYRSIADLPNWEVGYEIGRREKSLAMAKTEANQQVGLDVKARAEEIYNTMSVADLLDVAMDTATALAKTEARQEARERTFKQANKFSDAISKMVMHDANTKFVVRLILAFDKSMSNYIKAAFDLTGAGVATGMSRALLNLARGRQESLWFKSKGEAEQETLRIRQHKANLAFGRGVIGGGGGLVLGHALAALGVIGNPEDEEVKRKGWAGILYFGDTPVDLGWLGPLSVPLSMGAGYYHNGRDGLLHAFYQSLKQAPLVRGTKQVTDWINIFDRKGEALEEAIGTAAGKQVTSLIPGIVKEAARVTTEDRDTRIKGEGFSGAFFGPIKGAIPGLRSTLPMPRMPGEPAPPKPPSPPKRPQPQRMR